MKFNCPHCRKELDFMELKQDSDLYAIIKMQPVFGKYSHLAWAYVELFGVLPMSKHTAKIRSILEVLKMVFQAEAFTFNKKRYSISQAGIAEALNVVVLKNFQDRLENHNYLKKVMIGISEREERESGKQAERDLRKKEAVLMSGGRYPEAEEKVQLPDFKDVPPAYLTDEQIEENRRRMKDLLKKIGG
jgi:hypothetical protein